MTAWCRALRCLPSSGIYIGDVVYMVCTDNVLLYIRCLAKLQEQLNCTYVVHVWRVAGGWAVGWEFGSTSKKTFLVVPFLIISPNPKP